MKKALLPRGLIANPEDRFSRIEALMIFRGFQTSHGTDSFTLCLLVSSADTVCKQFVPRSGLTKRQAESGSKLFDTLVVCLKVLIKSYFLRKKSARASRK